jgi:hypothetical protein
MAGGLAVTAPTEARQAGLTAKTAAVQTAVTEETEVLWQEMEPTVPMAVPVMRAQMGRGAHPLVPWILICMFPQADWAANSELAVPPAVAAEAAVEVLSVSVAAAAEEEEAAAGTASPVTGVEVEARPLAS